MFHYLLYTHLCKICYFDTAVCLCKILLTIIYTFFIILLSCLFYKPNLFLFPGGPFMRVLNANFSRTVIEVNPLAEIVVKK